MNYEEMTDFEISCCVVAAELNLLDGWFPYKFDEENKVFFLRSGNAKRRVEVAFDCNNPSDVWPVIASMIKAGHFIAFEGDSVICDDWHVYHDAGQELRAAMIVYLRMNEDNE